MQSEKFEFLREKFPLLSDLGALAEAVIYTDPGSATTRLRSFAEEVVEIYLCKNGYFQLIPFRTCCKIQSSYSCSVSRRISIGRTI